MQIAGVLEKVEMTPGLLNRIVSRKFRTIGGEKAMASLKIQPDVKLLFYLAFHVRKFNFYYLPGLTQIQTKRKEALKIVVHRAKLQK